jgi:hypothetical protein
MKSLENLAVEPRGTPEAFSLHVAKKSEYATLFLVVLRTCTVAVKDLRDVEDSVEVSAETLHEDALPQRSC